LSIAPTRPEGLVELSAGEAASYLRIAAEAVSIKRHYDLYLWLNGELQQLLPHEILISAWGDFTAWQPRLDVVSSLPAIRTRNAGACAVDLLSRMHAQWRSGGGQPLLVQAAAANGSRAICTCHLHCALRGMRSLLVHGARDQRNGSDSLYMVLSSAGFAEDGRGTRLKRLAGLLFCQIDIACRQVAALPLLGAASAAGLELSSREHEILDCICRGKTNLAIAQALDISVFTVKNHLQRIFRKIGVTSRTQAAAKSHEAVRRFADIGASPADLLASLVAPAAHGTPIADR
jgi:transcriptional regulator EpsA